VGLEEGNLKNKRKPTKRQIVKSKNPGFPLEEDFLMESGFVSDAFIK
tara:strand:- start:1183 stop:1323 length:141 start_codon:yes stop_codon:yes gene_type:complete